MAKGRRVLHVSQSVEGGVDIVVTDLVRQQVARGWEVHVACPTQGYLAENVVASGAIHHGWEATREPGPAVPREIRALSRIVRGVEPDVVHLHSSKAGLAGRLALRGRLPTVFSPHAWSFFHVKGVTRRAALAWERLAVRWADVVLCGSEGERQTGQDAGIHANFRVIPNSSWIDARGLTQPEARAALQLDPDAPIAVCLGRYAAQKGQDVLLAAWPAVTRAVPAAQLVLVGFGPDEEYLRQIAPEGVRFSPASDRLSVVRWIMAADVLAFPSRWETLSLAVLESLELGRAVVVSDCQGMSEALAGGPGTMVPKDSPPDLAEALTPFLADRALAARTGTAAAEHYRTTHGRQRAERFDTYSALLEGLIATGHADS